MLFSITHRSLYSYANPASESFMEVRLCPLGCDRQTLHDRSLRLSPSCVRSTHVDYFGNTVETFSVPHRHDSLEIVSVSRVETHPAPPPAAVRSVSVSEARQIYRSRQLELYDFLNESDAVGFSSAINREANRFLRPGEELGRSVEALCAWLHREIAYKPGSTVITTRPDEVLRQRSGVCQDLAQLMIAILRSGEIPARYVCGYIETEDQRKASEAGAPRLVGFAESHAWVEVGLPGGFWWGLDPTNNIPAGERHVVVSRGRDYLDTTPTRGVFKGSSAQVLTVAVEMRRVAEIEALPPVS